jgi:hypothetical protein
VDDINLGLEHFYGDFNVVHAQLIASGVCGDCIATGQHTHVGPKIKDYHHLIDDISRVLRPGGLAIIVEWDFSTWDANKQQVVLGTHELGPPWWSRWLAFAQIAVRNSGGSVEAASNIRRWMSENPAFEDIVQDDIWIPTSHWVAHDEMQQRIGATMRDDILASALDFLPHSGLIVTVGIFEFRPTTSPF